MHSGAEYREGITTSTYLLTALWLFRYECLYMCAPVLLLLVWSVEVCQWRSQVFEWGGTYEKPDLLEAFHERCTGEFGRDSVGPLVFQKKNWICDWRRCVFPLSTLEGTYLHSSVSSQSISYITFSTLPHCTSLFLRKFGHVMRPSFSKIGGTSLQARTRDSASGSWLGQ